MLNTVIDRERVGDDAELAKIVEMTVRGSTLSVNDGVTLPPAVYGSQAFFDLEVDAIFKREWLCVGHVSQLREVGDYFTLELLGEPMVVVRGPDRIRALSTVCRHRWAPVARGSGNAKAFSCPFHKWTYALDGHLIGAPLMDQAMDFDRKSCRLPEFKSEVVDDLGLIFVNFLDDAPSVTAQLATLCDRVRAEGWALKDLQVVHALDQVNNYNWKVQVETYVECYHHVGGHEKTLQRLMPAASSWCEEDKGSWTVCASGLTDNFDILNAEERQALASFGPGVKPGDTIGHIVVAYPFTLVTFMAGGADLRILSPQGPGKTWSRIMVLRERAQIEQPGFDAWLAHYNATADIVNGEDNDINDMQQFGVASSRAKAGRFSHLEGGAWNIAQYVRRKLAIQ